MSNPLDINTICAWLSRHELEPHHVRSVLNSLSSGLKAHHESRGDSESEILDKLKPLDDASDAMEAQQLAELPEGGEDSGRMAAEFARSTGAAEVLGVRS